MAEYTASMDMGAYVIVINAEKVVVTGNKVNDKMYYRHSQRPGGLKSETFKHLQAVSPAPSTLSTAPNATFIRFWSCFAPLLTAESRLQEAGTHCCLCK